MLFLSIAGYEIILPLFMALLAPIFIASSYVDDLKFPVFNLGPSDFYLER